MDFYLKGIGVFIAVLAIGGFSALVSLYLLCLVAYHKATGKKKDFSKQWRWVIVNGLILLLFIGTYYYLNTTAYYENKYVQALDNINIIFIGGIIPLGVYLLLFFLINTLLKRFIKKPAR